MDLVRRIRVIQHSVNIEYIPIVKWHDKKPFAQDEKIILSGETPEVSYTDLPPCKIYFKISLVNSYQKKKGNNK